MISTCPHEPARTGERVTPFAREPLSDGIDFPHWLKPSSKDYETKDLLYKSRAVEGVELNDLCRPETEESRELLAYSIPAYDLTERKCKALIQCAQDCGYTSITLDSFAGRFSN